MIHEELARRRSSELFRMQNLQDVSRLDGRETEGLSWFGFPKKPTLRQGFKCK